PLVLSAHTERFGPPGEAEAVLSDRPRERPTFVDSGSVFLAREASGGIAIPPTLNLPPAVKDLEIPIPLAAGRVVQATAAFTAETQVVLLTNLPDTLRDPREFLRRVLDARDAAGYARLLYAPGIATPSNLALLVYCGLDLVDDTRVLLEGGWGRLHTADGWWTDEAAKLACDCAPCREGDKKPYRHNALALLRERRTVRAALAADRLRELAERRAVNDSWSTAVLRHLDLRHHEWQERHFPVAGGETETNAPASLTRPDLLRYRHRLKERYAKPPSTRVLVLLPCSARKPYSESRSHRRFRDALRAAGNSAAVHEVMVTVPLGVVPRELERFHPVAGYDLAVTGDWGRDEVAILQDDLRAYLERNRYERVIVHLHTEREFVREVLGDKAVYTAEDHPTEESSLRNLEAAAREATASLPASSWGDRHLEEMRNVARFQFGADVGNALLDGARLHGRYPFVRIVRAGTQRGMHTDRGMISLTLAGAEVLSGRDAFCVEIEDFQPAGNIFAVGVTAATADIRIGDEVAVRHGKDVRAVGTAAMTPREMRELRRGEAVRVRHRLPAKAL
ncbi:MAG TPA: DUF5591 domain-containing protein, partial [Thermoplasmata archaeon]|nr:DUF5591 domain-containing protein [Thermoplasmata archaeon]